MSDERPATALLRISRPQKVRHSSTAATPHEETSAARSDALTPAPSIAQTNSSTSPTSASMSSSSMQQQRHSSGNRKPASPGWPLGEDPDDFGGIKEYVTKELLQEASATDDLDSVTYIELQADTSMNSLGRLGQLLPNVQELKLTGSNIASIRDLGTALRNVTVLWVAKCNLSDLNGIAMMPQLQELYAAFNDVSLCMPLTMCECLQIIDLEGNSISDVAQVEYLGLIGTLSSVTLEGNPFLQKYQDTSEYRDAIFKALPSISVLDDVPKGTASEATATTFNAESLLIPRLLKKRVSTEDDAELQQSIRPSTARPLTAQLGKRRPPTSHGGVVAGPVPSTASTSAGHDASNPAQSASTLTRGAGVVFQGNPLKALLARKKKEEEEDMPQMTPDEVLAELFQAVGLDGIDGEVERSRGALSTAVEDDPFVGMGRDEVVSELKSWRAKFKLISSTSAETPPSHNSHLNQGRPSSDEAPINSSSSSIGNRRIIPKKPKGSRQRPVTARAAVGRRRDPLPSSPTPRRSRDDQAQGDEQAERALSQDDRKGARRQPQLPARGPPGIRSHSATAPRTMPQPPQPQSQSQRRMPRKPSSKPALPTSSSASLPMGESSEPVNAHANALGRRVPKPPRGGNTTTPRRPQTATAGEFRRRRIRSASAEETLSPMPGQVSRQQPHPPTARASSGKGPRSLPKPPPREKQ